MTRRECKEYWIETKRIVNGEVKVSLCCCAGPGLSPRQCADRAEHKTPCRCDCHRKT